MSEITVVYEDNHVLCAVKPHGVPSQPDSTLDMDMLSMAREYVRVSRAKQGEAFIGLVHRLDRPVGGVMAFAKTTKAASRLSQQIRERAVKKTYLAVLDGDPGQSRALEHYIEKPAAGGRVIVTDTSSGRRSAQATLEFEAVARDEAARKTLAVIRLITGRPHQIRAQFAHIGSPVSGDRKYGLHGRDPRAQDEPWPALWAARLEFLSVVGGEPRAASAAPPGSYPWSLFASEIAFLGL